MRILAATLLAGALNTQAFAQAPDRTITLGQVGLSFYAVVGGVVQEILEHEGYTVRVIQGSHAQVFPQLASGEVDVFAAAWLPNGHAALYEPARKTTFIIAPLYEDARFFWVVPDYIPDTLLASLDDLLKPAVQARISHRIISLPAETGLTISANRVLATYGLASAGYRVEPGPPEAWLAAFRDAVAAGEWIVFPLWQPQWLNAAYSVRPLADPRHAYGEPDTAYLLGNQSLRGKLTPHALAVLSRIRLSIRAVTAMDRMVNVEGLTPREAAARWMAENAPLVASWTQAD